MDRSLGESGAWHVDDKNVLLSAVWKQKNYECQIVKEKEFFFGWRIRITGLKICYKNKTIIHEKNTRSSMKNMRNSLYIIAICIFNMHI